MVEVGKEMVEKEKSNPVTPTQAGVATDLFVIDTNPPVSQQEFLRYFGLVTHHEAGNAGEEILRFCLILSF